MNATAMAARKPSSAPARIAVPLATISAYVTHLDPGGPVCLGPRLR
jgi:hypothetical protein